MARVYYSAATCSWIDPATGLEEVDTAPITHLDKPRDFLTGDRGFRFTNFIAAWVDFSATPGGVTQKGFANESGLYRGPSFLSIPSHAFSVLQETFDEGDCIRFTQTVGARTASPEVVGGGLGMVVGAAMAVAVPGLALLAIAGGGLVGGGTAHQIKGFPPIWTKLQLRMYRDGFATAQLLQHSLFPSMTTYVPPGQEAAGALDLLYYRTNHTSGQPYYNATKEVQLPDWQARGWGPVAHPTARGACAGNPWGINKGVTGGSENLPN